jgi:hypothetical protein
MNTPKSFQWFLSPAFLCVLDMTTKRCWLAHSLFSVLIHRGGLTLLVACHLCVFLMGLVPSDDCVFCMNEDLGK